MPLWTQFVATAATLKVAAALVLYFAGLTTVSVKAAVPPAIFAALAGAFAALGVALLTANRNDVRAAWLGGAFTLLAVPLTSVLLPAESNPGIAWIGRTRLDAFLAAFLWRFTLEFPTPSSGSLRRVGSIVAAVSAIIGTAALATNLAMLFWPVSEPGWRTLLATGTTSGSGYWLALLVPSAAAFLTMLARMIAATGEYRARSRMFIGGLVVGVLPFFIEVVIEESWPQYKALVHSPTVEPWLGAILFGALALVPFVTAYAVVYDRVVNLRVVVRAAIQYALAHYTIVGVTTVPFLAFAVYLYRQRAESLGALLTGPRPLALIAAVALGVTALRARRRWLAALDRRFFREHYDAQLLVTQLIGEDVISGRPVEIAERLAVELDRALHARADLFVVDETSSVLRDPRGQAPPIAARATLVTLAMADARPMDLHLGRGSALERLPQSERKWLADGMYRLIVPLRSSAGHPVGLLALGQKRSELEFSDGDRRTLAALAASIALAIENQRLRQTPEPRTELPARECVLCSRLYAPDASACSCGGALADAAAPRILRGVYQFERRIGAGGMGVVYLARDLTLGRDVAIKTLPRVTPEHVSRLRREAQAMASVIDTNLAVIYGIETWRDVPFLVEEYLAAGTLAARLQRGPMPIDEVLDLGITLAGALDRLHAAGIVHCDIKPSNIGFTRHGVAKLLDFGLAHLLREAAPDIVSTNTFEHNSDVESVVITDRGVMGTPPYMSPEALAGAQPDSSFDIWALAVVLYESIGGERPFIGRNADKIASNIRQATFVDLRTHRPQCPPRVAQFFVEVFARRPSERPIGAPALKEQLLALRAQGA